MKMTRVIAFLLAMMLMLTACGGSSTTATTAATEAPAAAETPAAAEAPAAAATPAVVGDKLAGPFAITSCGQSPGATMLNVVATQAGLTSTAINDMTAADLPADAKTLIITMGTSGKGMGAAGTDVDMEIARVTEVANAAKAAGMVVCAAHVEGMGRRTDANDQASIDGVLALADVVLVIDDSDSDGFFTDYCNTNGLKLHKVAQALDAGSVME